MVSLTLSSSELERYDRQIIIPGWGVEGQKKLKAAKVVIMGIGGLGCPAATYLAAAGVGKIVIIDKEKYELSNLNRQILGWDQDIGRFKGEAAKEKLEALNPTVEIDAVITEITRENIRELIQGATVVLDGMDNWKTRFIINEGCVNECVPFVHAGIFGFHGQIMTIVPGKGPCLRCVIPKEPEEIKRFPVVGVTPALFGILQAMEAIKLITGIGRPLIGRMLYFDGEDMRFSTIEVKRNELCPTCSYLWKG